MFGTAISVVREPSAHLQVVVDEFSLGRTFQLMVETVVDYAIFMLDTNGVVSSWNLGAEKLKGYKAEEIIGQHFSVFYPGRDLDGLLAEELVTAATVGRLEGEGWRVRKDGSTFWAHEVLTALHRNDGSLLGFARVTRDLTERERAAKELAAAYAHLNSVLESTSNSVVTISHGWTLLYANRKALVSLPDFAVGKNYWDCFPAVLGTPTEALLRKAMEERCEIRYEIYFAPYKAWFRAQGFPTDEGLSLFFSDITEEKQMQEQLLLEQVLREKRIEALSHMAGGLAHEISNPLAIIHGRASDLRDLAAGEMPVDALEVRNACDSILKTSERASSILRGLRGFAREASHDPMQPASIYDIAGECVELQQARFYRNDVELRFELDEGIPLLLCRETQVGQIVTNLLNNAFDAIVQSDATERWVALRASSSDGKVTVEVADSGPGIADHFKAHLMEPFFTTKELGVGMGVGLSLSRAIAQDHGGTLMLCSGRENTCFRLVLPLEQKSVGHADSPGPMEGAE